MAAALQQRVDARLAEIDAERNGLQLLLGPGTSGVDVTFILLVVDAKASRTRSTHTALPDGGNGCTEDR